MRPFFFVIRAEPTEAAVSAQDIAGAIVHIWVMDSSLEQAEARARSYILDYAWIALKTDYAFEINDKQIASLGAEERTLYQKALRHGIAADFLGYPKKARSDGMIEIRSLKPPFKQGGAKS